MLEECSYIGLSLRTQDTKIVIEAMIASRTRPKWSFRQRSYPITENRLDSEFETVGMGVSPTEFVVHAVDFSAKSSCGRLYTYGLF